LPLYPGSRRTRRWNRRRAIDSAICSVRYISVSPRGRSAGGPSGRSHPARTSRPPRCCAYDHSILSHSASTPCGILRRLWPSRSFPDSLWQVRPAGRTCVFQLSPVSRISPGSRGLDPGSRGNASPSAAGTFRPPRRDGRRNPGMDTSPLEGCPAHASVTYLVANTDGVSNVS
jgi:hypothetical protein